VPKLIGRDSHTLSLSPPGERRGPGKRLVMRTKWDSRRLRPLPQRPFFYPVRVTASCCSAWIEIISLVPEALGRKVATLCAGIISDPPVFKFHPLRGSVLRTANLPKPRMMIGPPFRRVVLRNSRILSSSVAASFSEIPLPMCFRLEPVD
jgi:hypothetical protein